MKRTVFTNMRDGLKWILITPVITIIYVFPILVLLFLGILQIIIVNEIFGATTVIGTSILSLFLMWCIIYDYRFGGLLEKCSLLAEDLELYLWKK
jgi:hypothetical protein